MKGDPVYLNVYYEQSYSKDVILSVLQGYRNRQPEQLP